MFQKVDSTGAVVVGGFITMTNSHSDTWVQRYTPAGKAIGTWWPQTHNGPADSDDVANAVAIGAGDVIYAAGTATFSAGVYHGWSTEYAP